MANPVSAIDNPTHLATHANASTPPQQSPTNPISSPNYVVIRHEDTLTQRTIVSNLVHVRLPLSAILFSQRKRGNRIYVSAPFPFHAPF